MEDTNKECKCPECERREKLAREHEDFTFALLLALMPMVVLTLFGQIGLL